MDLTPTYIIEAQHHDTGVWYRQEFTVTDERGRETRVSEFRHVEDAIERWKRFRLVARPVSEFFPVRVVELNTPGAIPAGGRRIIRSSVATGCFYMGKIAA